MGVVVDQHRQGDRDLADIERQMALRGVDPLAFPMSDLAQWLRVNAGLSLVETSIAVAGALQRRARARIVESQKYAALRGY